MKYQVAELDTKPSERWYSKNKEKHIIGMVNQMGKVSSKIKRKSKIIYSQKFKDAIKAAL